MKYKKRILYFSNIKGIGDLYLDKVYAQFECEPILFTCLTTPLGKDVGDTYFCICSEIRNIQRWIVTKCSGADLKALKNKEVDIRSVLLRNSSVVLIEQGMDGIEQHKLISTNQIDELDLPEKGVYLR